MAAPAQPAPYPGDRTSLAVDGHLLTRTFADPTGQPLTGRLTGTPSARVDSGEAVIPAVPFRVDVTAGVLEVSLPAGTYVFRGNLQGPGGSVAETFTVTLPE